MNESLFFSLSLRLFVLFEAPAVFHDATYMKYGYSFLRFLHALSCGTRIADWKIVIQVKGYGMRTRTGHGKLLFFPPCCGTLGAVLF